MRPGLDAKVARCPRCGAWTYSPRPCTTCHITTAAEALK